MNSKCVFSSSPLDFTLITKSRSWNGFTKSVCDLAHVDLSRLTKRKEALAFFLNVYTGLTHTHILALSFARFLFFKVYTGSHFRFYLRHVDIRFIEGNDELG